MECDATRKLNAGWFLKSLRMNLFNRKEQMLYEVAGIKYVKVKWLIVTDRTQEKLNRLVERYDGFFQNQRLRMPGMEFTFFIPENNIVEFNKSSNQ